MWAIIGVLTLVVVAVVGLCRTDRLLGAFTPFAICVPVGLAVPAIGLLILARYMPRKTPKGAEEAAKWLAFKRYMENIEQYTKVEEAQEIFDRYLPYAIAFGLEKSWISEVRQGRYCAAALVLSGPLPGATAAPLHLVDGRGLRAGRRRHARPAEGGSMAPPSMSDMSRGMGTSLAGMSAGLGAMLVVVCQHADQPAGAAGGSGSWGGSSWSGGGGFGGGGWSGGGGFGGGGGGGSSFG